MNEAESLFVYPHADCKLTITMGRVMLQYWMRSQSGNLEMRKRNNKNPPALKYRACSSLTLLRAEMQMIGRLTIQFTALGKDTVRLQRTREAVPLVVAN